MKKYLYISILLLLVSCSNETKNIDTNDSALQDQKQQQGVGNSIGSSSQSNGSFSDLTQ